MIKIKAILGVSVVAALAAGTARADVEVTAGYLDDLITILPGPPIDIGASGGGIYGQPDIGQVFVDPSFATNGRVIGMVLGKFFVTGVPQSGGVAPDLEGLFDVSHQLIQVSDLGNLEGTFAQSIPLGAVGYDGEVNEAYDVSENFPPTPGGAATVFVAHFDQNPALDVYEGEVSFLFALSPGDHVPSLEPGGTYVITTLIASASSGPVTFGFVGNFPAMNGLAESQLDLFDGSLSITGATAGDGPLTTAALLTSVAITVVPEPGTLIFAAVATLMVRRRPERARG